MAGSKEIEKSQLLGALLNLVFQAGSPQRHCRLVNKKGLLFCFRKLAKSTLVLVLVFGVHYIVFICQPHSFTGLWWEIRMHCELFFNSFQVNSSLIIWFL
jgi:hypothetical protein